MLAASFVNWILIFRKIKNKPILLILHGNSKEHSLAATGIFPQLEIYCVDPSSPTLVERDSNIY